MPIHQNTNTVNLTYWSARVLAVIYICFLAIFALDVFIPGKPLEYYFLPLFIHLMPNLILAGILLFAWRHEKVGGVLFLLTAILFTILFRTYTSVLPFTTLSFPVFLIGGLFLLHSHLKKANT